jgi:hypothetical protein
MEFSAMLTDYVLAVICFVFAFILFRAQNGKTTILKWLWIIFFTSIALGAIAGGSVHGFCGDETSPACKLLWLGALVILGLTTTSCWILGGVLWMGEQTWKRWFCFASILFVVYALILMVFSQNFLVAIINYFPPLIFLLIISVRGYIKTKAVAYRQVIAGILLSFFAAAIQQAHIGINPIYFDYTSTYHLLEAIALFLMFKGALVL